MKKNHGSWTVDHTIWEDQQSSYTSRESEFVEEQVTWMECLAAFTAMCVGASRAWISPTLKRLQKDCSESRNPWCLPWDLEGDEVGWVVSLRDVGVILGCLPAAVAVSQWGRRWALLWTAPLMLLAWLLALTASTAEMLFAHSVLAGIAESIITVAAPMYIGEIASSCVRGRLNTLPEIFNSAGLLLVYSLGPYQEHTHLIHVCALLPFSFIATFLWMPESPYFLILREKHNDAEKSLRRLRCRADVRGELDSIRVAVEGEMAQKGSWRDIVHSRSNRRALGIALILAAVQGFGGLGAIMSYSSITLQDYGSFTADEFVIIFGAARLLAIILSYFLMDKVGRRPLLVVFGFLASLSMTVGALYFRVDSYMDDGLQCLRWVPAAAVVLFGVSFALGPGPVPVVVQAEIFPTNVKGVAISVVSIFLLIVMFVVDKMYQVVRDNMGVDVIYGVFAASCGSGALFAACCMTETKGKTFQEIQRELERRPGVCRRPDQSEAPQP